uniref:HTH CENPB-type domain-containing protein n=1 Tax=Parastrongyloides trichosuri TaxID=131310 RepID=A0A0N4ZPF6_PARTI
MIPIRIAGTQPPQGFIHTNIFDNSSSSSIQGISTVINPNKRKLSHTNDEDNYEDIRYTKQRKLKIYSVQNKLDIIDYAKVIGNRAAGREFNVAESSIREWRKNEEKLKDNYEKELQKRSETVEVSKAKEIITQHLDAQLIEYINTKNGKLSWYDIKRKAEEIGKQYKVVTQFDITETPINMGWVSRFMKRALNKIPHVPPPSNSNHSFIQHNQNTNTQNGRSIQRPTTIHPTTTMPYLNVQQTCQQPFVLDTNVIASLIQQLQLQKQQQQQSCIINAFLAQQQQQQNSNKISLNYSSLPISGIENRGGLLNVMNQPRIDQIQLQSLLQPENINILQLINNITNMKSNGLLYSQSQTTIGGITHGNNNIITPPPTSPIGNNNKYLIKNNDMITKKGCKNMKIIDNNSIIVSPPNSVNIPSKNLCNKRKGCTPKKSFNGVTNDCCYLKESEDIKQSDTEDSLGCDSSSKLSESDSIGIENRKMDDIIINNVGNDGILINCNEEGELD